MLQKAGDGTAGRGKAARPRDGLAGRNGTAGRDRPPGHSGAAGRDRPPGSGPPVGAVTNRSPPEDARDVAGERPGDVGSSA
ncbi:hypothetical protein GCM10010140_02150 [Streptosporangium pseudovulgare]|uniref:Uncharacterized protein n=1 Tax=Streptosporangium pseudovulgare TaxID=35765 RepID=A0ABQ2QGD3_9ACTN|nr:hypothetical protein GCM10010140_02150 [Streptosporangium pseudovulgare]